MEESEELSRVVNQVYRERGEIHAIVFYELEYEGKEFGPRAC